MADTLTLKEVELDYEAEEVEEAAGTPTPGGVASSPRQGEDEDDDGEIPSSPARQTDEICSDPGEAEDGEEQGDADEGELEEGEELEDGEISDEDEALKTERLEPKPVCRFFSKGQCTWGQSCRFLHPGVLDKGNYSMFAAPRPILPGEPEDSKPVPKEKQVMIAPPVPAHESAWERGLRQAKEMRRRSSKRRETDVEYEEKKASLSLTQVELDKENDYYTRPASPAHTHDPYADDDYARSEAGDPYDTYHPEVRRVAPPPPPEFQARAERERSSRYSESPPPRVRRIAPPRSPSPTRRAAPPPPVPGGPPPPPPPRGAVSGGARFRGGEDWADPWMRGGPDRGKGPGGPGKERGGRRRSYSSGSSRSSSGSSRSRSPRRRRRYSSSFSSRSSSRSRSRSSTPAGIPRRSTGALGVKREGAQQRKNTATLQKRLQGLSQGKTADSEKKRRRTTSSDEGMKGKGIGSKSSKTRPGDTASRREGRSGTGSKDQKGERSGDKAGKPSEPFKMSLHKNKIKLTLTTAKTTTKPNSAVLEKLGMTNEDLAEQRRAAKRKQELEKVEAAAAAKRAKQADGGGKQADGGTYLIETLKERLKNKVEAGKAKAAAAAASEKSNKAKSDVAAPAPVPAPAVESPVKAKKVKSKEGPDSKGRREELLKQLKAVEDAIHRKRTKLDV